MGVWGVGLFQDDVAVDTRNAFDDALARGLQPGQAADMLLANPPRPLDDADDGPVIRLALAALLLREGALRNDVRDEAARAIASRAAYARWEEAPNAMRMARERVLERFSALLTAGAATPDKLQAVTEPQFRRGGQS
ncbi:MAG TPA: hypothetical protein VF808_03170 [Ktedonobacterales bacterium]